MIVLKKEKPKSNVKFNLGFAWRSKEFRCIFFGYHSKMTVTEALATKYGNGEWLDVDDITNSTEFY